MKRFRRVRLSVNGTGLDFDRDYGCDNRTGWTASFEGAICEPQLTTLRRAARSLIGAWADADKRGEG